MLTIEEFSALPDGIFRYGTIEEQQEKFTWQFAVFKLGNAWGIYGSKNLEMQREELKEKGTLQDDIAIIRQIVPCDDAALGRYLSRLP